MYIITKYIFESSLMQFLNLLGPLPKGTDSSEPNISPAPIPIP